MFEKHPLLAPFCLILLIGLPYVVAFYPGIFEWDALAQINEGIGGAPKTNANPIFGTELIGLVFLNVRKLGLSDNIALFVLNISQFLIQSVVFAYAFYVMYRMRTPI